MNYNEQEIFKIFLQLYEQYKKNNFVIDKTNTKIVQIINVNIKFNPELGPYFNINNVKKTNIQYVQKQLQWYKSQDLNIQFIQEYAKLWKSCADINGNINSNYGWCIYSNQNYNQFENCVKQLKNNKQSRRAIMIYTRPSIQYQYCENGKSDFICSNYNQFMIRDNKLISIYDMRSNDAIYGFFNDYAWAWNVYVEVYNELKQIYPQLLYGNIIWKANSFHIYQKHFKLLQKIIKSQETIMKKIVNETKIPQSNLTVISGLPGSGKTQRLLQKAYQLAQMNNVYLISLEINSENINDRLKKISENNVKYSTGKVFNISTFDGIPLTFEKMKDSFSKINRDLILPAVILIDTPELYKDIDIKQMIDVFKNWSNQIDIPVYITLMTSKLQYIVN